MEAFCRASPDLAGCPISSRFLPRAGCRLTGISSLTLPQATPRSLEGRGHGRGAAEARVSRAAVPAGGNGGGAAACDSGRPLTLHARRCADARDVGVSGGLLRLPCGYARRRCTTPESRAGGSRSVVREGRACRDEGTQGTDSANDAPARVPHAKRPRRRPYASAGRRLRHGGRRTEGR